MVINHLLTGMILQVGPGLNFLKVVVMDDEMDADCCNHMCVCLSLSYFMVVDCYPHIVVWITSNSSCSHAS